METNLLFQVLYNMPGFPEVLKEGTEYGSTFRKHVNELVNHSHHIRSQVLVKPGQLVSEMYFVNQGAARGYLYDESSKKELTTFLWEKTHFIVVSNSFFFYEPADMYVEVMPGTELISATNNDMIETFKEFPEAEVLSRTLAWQYDEEHRQRERMFRLPAEERCRELIKKRPDVWNKFPMYVIASYLNMAPETLSRLRQQINSAD